MASFNKVVLMGNLTRDPQLKYLPNQTPLVEFGLAMNHKYRTANGENREDVCFVDCTVFGRGAEVINQYCQKGKALLVEGRLKLDTWEDKNGGGKRSKHSVVVDNFQFVGGRDDSGGGGGGDYSRSNDDYGDRGKSRGNSGGGGGGGGNYSRGNSSRNDNASRQPANEPFDDSEQFGEDDIPF